MTKHNDKRDATQVDFDIHGQVGIRLLGPSPDDVRTVARQVGPFQAAMAREPDIVIRFVADIETGNLRYATLNTTAFSDNGFFVLRSRKRMAKALLALDQVGRNCEIVCETGIPAVPLLIQLVNMSFVRKGYVPLHGSGFTYDNVGIAVCGWAKGGKTEALLSFAAHGARYVGDEWIVLTPDGERMLGIPERIRLWDWHLSQLRALYRYVPGQKRRLFHAIRSLCWLKRNTPSFLNRTAPLKLLHEAIPALQRQMNATFDPELVFGEQTGPFSAKLDKIFLVVSHQGQSVAVEETDPLLVAKRMAASVRFEQWPLMSRYLEFSFAFPDRSNQFLEHVHELQYDMLCRAMTGKQTYLVHHPYPVAFESLYRAMKPYVEATNASVHACYARSS